MQEVARRRAFQAVGGHALVGRVRLTGRNGLDYNLQFEVSMVSGSRMGGKRILRMTGAVDVCSAGKN